MQSTTPRTSRVIGTAFIKNREFDILEMYDFHDAVRIRPTGSIDPRSEQIVTKRDLCDKSTNQLKEEALRDSLKGIVAIYESCADFSETAKRLSLTPAQLAGKLKAAKNRGLL